MGADCWYYVLALFCPWAAIWCYYGKCTDAIAIAVLLEFVNFHFGAVIYACCKLSGPRPYERETVVLINNNAPAQTAPVN